MFDGSWKCVVASALMQSDIMNTVNRYPTGSIDHRRGSNPIHVLDKRCTSEMLVVYEPGRIPEECEHSLVSNGSWKGVSLRIIERNFTRKAIRAFASTHNKRALIWNFRDKKVIYKTVCLLFNNKNELISTNKDQLAIAYN